MHCHAGVSRSATVCMAYIMKALDYDLRSAYDFVKSKRPCVSPNLHFMGQLLEFEKRLGNCTASRNDVDSFASLTCVQEEDERLCSLPASWVGKDKRRAISTPSSLELCHSPFDGTTSITHKSIHSPSASSLPNTPLTGLRSHVCLPNKSQHYSHSCSLQSLAALSPCSVVAKSCTPFCKVTESL